MAIVAELQQEVDPSDVGFDGERLQRIDRHLARLVEQGVLPGALAVVSRGGKVVHVASVGERAPGAGEPVALDAIWRIHSMTKPVTAVAAMMLWEEGAFSLDEPVESFIPAFGEMRVFESGTALRPTTVPAREPIRIWHLLTHTSGLTYGIFDTACDVLYRQAGLSTRPAMDNAEFCERLGRVPLLFQPGTEWSYGTGLEVLGRLIEVVSGRRLDEFFTSRIFEPLDMTDTDFAVPAAERERFVELCAPDPQTGKAVVVADDDPRSDPRLSRPVFLGGGGGLVSTVGDYHRFATMLLNRGELDGRRLLGSRTVDFMVRNHLPGGADLGSFGRPFYGIRREGLGFGLGMSVVLDPAAQRSLRSRGSYGWGGAAGTLFWVDPVESMIAVLLVQVLGHGRAGDDFRQLVYQALVD
jgi:CubicO group peptidase (beta-lactamase class C family)